MPRERCGVVETTDWVRLLVDSRQSGAKAKILKFTNYYFAIPRTKVHTSAHPPQGRFCLDCARTIDQIPHPLLMQTKTAADTPKQFLVIDD